MQETWIWCWVSKIPGEGNGYPLQDSCLEDFMDREARQTAVHGVSKSRTWLSSWAQDSTYALKDQVQTTLYAVINENGRQTPVCCIQGTQVQQFDDPFFYYPLAT